MRTSEEATVEVLVSDTVVQITTELDRAALAALVGSLRPLDVPAAMAQVGEQAQAGGAMRFGL